MRRILPATYERHIIDPQRQAGKFVAYADTGFYNVALFQKQLGQFRTAEIDNERALRAQKLRMPFMAHPIMHWCPMPVSFRSRTRRWQDRLADTIAGAGVHPIAPLQGEALVRLMTRDDAVLPYADDFLQLPSMPPVRYWSLRGGKSNLQARGGWRRALARWL